MDQEVSITRTMKVSKADGDDTWRTARIKTYHPEAHACCCNTGVLGLGADVEISDNRIPVAQRLHAQVVQQELNSSTMTDSDFDNWLKNEKNQRDINIFRVLSGLCAKMMIVARYCPWLQPDISYSKMVWSSWDSMLEEKHNLPKPYDRTKLKRGMVHSWELYMESVVKKFGFDTTAASYPDMMPNKDGFLEPWCITQLTDCFLTMVPSFGTIVSAMSHTLDYNPHTSAHLLHTLNLVCDAHGGKVGQHMNAIGKDECPKYDPGEDQTLSVKWQSFVPAEGLSSKDVSERSSSYEKVRLLRLMCSRRLYERKYDGVVDIPLGIMHHALTDGVLEQQPRSRTQQRPQEAPQQGEQGRQDQQGQHDAMDLTVEEVVNVCETPFGPMRTESVAAACIPFVDDLLNSGYSQVHLSSWVRGQDVPASELCIPAAGLPAILGDETWSYYVKNKKTGGGCAAAAYDFAWREKASVVEKKESDKKSCWYEMAFMLERSDRNKVLTFGMTRPVVANCLWLLAQNTAENRRLVADHVAFGPQEYRLDDAMGATDSRGTTGHLNPTIQEFRRKQRNPADPTAPIVDPDFILPRYAPPSTHLPCCDPFEWRKSEMEFAHKNTVLIDTDCTNGASEFPARPAWTGVKDNWANNRLALLVASSRLPAAQIWTKVKMGQPVRAWGPDSNQQVQVNSFTVTNFSRWVTEVSLYLSVIPGIRNRTCLFALPGSLCAPGMQATEWRAGDKRTFSQLEDESQLMNGGMQHEQASADLMEAEPTSCSRGDQHETTGAQPGLATAAQRINSEPFVGDSSASNAARADPVTSANQASTSRLQLEGSLSTGGNAAKDAVAADPTATDNEDVKLSRLAWSWDMFQIYLTFKFCEDLAYDDAESYCRDFVEQWSDAFSDVETNAVLPNGEKDVEKQDAFNKEVKKLADSVPEITLRFPGFSTELIDLLSCQISKEPAKNKVSVSDSTHELNVSDEQIANVLSVRYGRAIIVTDPEVTDYKAQLYGTAGMLGVKGPLFHHSTLVKHNTTSLMKRGFLAANDTLNMSRVLDSDYDFVPRAFHTLAQEGKFPEWAEVLPNRRQPMTDGTLRSTEYQTATNKDANARGGQLTEQQKRAQAQADSVAAQVEHTITASKSVKRPRGAVPPCAS